MSSGQSCQEIKYDFPFQTRNRKIIGSFDIDSCGGGGLHRGGFFGNFFCKNRVSPNGTSRGVSPPASGDPIPNLLNFTIPDTPSNSSQTIPPGTYEVTIMFLHGNENDRASEILTDIKELIDGRNQKIQFINNAHDQYMKSIKHVLFNPTASEHTNFVHMYHVIQDKYYNTNEPFLYCLNMLHDQYNDLMNKVRETVITTGPPDIMIGNRLNNGTNTTVAIVLNPGIFGGGMKNNKVYVKYKNVKRLLRKDGKVKYIQVNGEKVKYNKRIMTIVV